MFVNNLRNWWSMDPCLTWNFSDCLVALRFVFLTQQQYSTVSTFSSVCTLRLPLSGCLSTVLNFTSSLLMLFFVQPLSGNSVINCWALFGTERAPSLIFYYHIIYFYCCNTLFYNNSIFTYSTVRNRKREINVIVIDSISWTRHWCRTSCRGYLASHLMWSMRCWRRTFWRWKSTAARNLRKLTD